MAPIGPEPEDLRQRARSEKHTARRRIVVVAAAIAVFGAAAAQVQVAAADPTGVGVVEREPSQAGEQCFQATGTHHSKTLLGNTFYKFTHSAEFCTDGTNVVRVENREHRFTDASAYAAFGDVIEDSVSRMPAAEVTSIEKARVDNCIPVKGCISSKYPFVRLTLRANGTWFATTGESEES